MKKGQFIMVDGIDGSGKGTIVNTIQKYLKNKNKKIFNLTQYFKKYNSFPKHETILKYDIIISGEPTYAGIGSVIRNEIIKKNSRQYSALSTAQAFSLDREILYKKIILPLLKENKILGAGLDVYNQEPYIGPLIEFKNVVLTPHVGSYAKELRIQMEIEAVANLIKGLNE